MLFSDLNLNRPLLNALSDLGYTQPTTIQARAFSVIMSGKDVLGIAQTGTGKTMAYLLPCLRLWQFSKDIHPQTLILVPTRELVVQVEREIKKLTAYMNVVTVGVYGGTNIRTQSEQVQQGVDVLVATPGRLIDLVMNGSIKMKSIKRLVIDEVDEMLNLGFRKQLSDILDLLPVKRQNLLFSATITTDVENFMEQHFNHPERIEAAPAGTPVEKITQVGYKVPNFYTKVNLLTLLLKENPEMKKVLVFTSSKKLADDLFLELRDLFPSKLGVIHSNKAQNNRFNVVKEFQNGNLRTLIATDLVARGLDISEVSHVVNFDMPEVPENYIHRIGRTGRADKEGVAISFITADETREKVEKLMQYKIPLLELPDNLEISEVLTEEEKPQINMKIIDHEAPKDKGEAFHEKKDKNKKVNMHKTRAQLLQEKYGKPKSRGSKYKK
jgi:ATP-dependent RNA helicase RhlE